MALGAFEYHSSLLFPLIFQATVVIICDAQKNQVTRLYTCNYHSAVGQLNFKKKKLQVTKLNLHRPETHHSATPQARARFPMAPLGYYFARGVSQSLKYDMGQPHAAGLGPSPSHLSGVRLFPFSFTSRSSSEESTGEVVLASRSSCSCWARYWAGFCLANLAQWRSSRCRRGKLACKGRTGVRGCPGAPSSQGPCSTWHTLADRTTLLS